MTRQPRQQRKVRRSMSMSGRRVATVTAFTHQGAVRPHSEDTIAVGAWLRSEPMVAPHRLEHRLDGPLLCLVADGLGGHAAGEVASRLAAACLSEAAALIQDAAGLANAVHDANRAVFAAMADNPLRFGMGTTVVALLLHPEGGLWVSVGDSRLYRIDEGRVVQLSTDDVPDSGAGHARSHIITQCLGGDWSLTEIVPRTGEVALQPSKRWLLCSDGLTDMLDDAAIAAAIGDDDLASVETLFHQAMAAGGADNVSILLIRVEVEGEPR